jgi:hypothetical protein
MKSNNVEINRNNEVMSQNVNSIQFMHNIHLSETVLQMKLRWNSRGQTA